MDQQQAREALATLNNMVLFNKRVDIRTLADVDPEDHLNIHLRIGIERGWYASQSPSLWEASLREPCWEYPSDLFAPIRESRCLVMENMSPPDVIKSKADPRVYELLHNFNILSCSEMLKSKVRQGERLTGFYMMFDFATRSEAEVALETLQGRLVGDTPVKLAVSKIPIKYGGTWDTGRAAGHNTIIRDQGSAVGTNFEEVKPFYKQCLNHGWIYLLPWTIILYLRRALTLLQMQELRYRQWVLGERDRKVR